MTNSSTFVVLWLVTWPSFSTSATFLIIYTPGWRFVTVWVCSSLVIFILIQKFSEPFSTLQSVSIQILACDPSANVQLSLSPSADAEPFTDWISYVSVFTKQIAIFKGVEKEKAEDGHPDTHTWCCLSFVAMCLRMHPILILQIF